MIINGIKRRIQNIIAAIVSAFDYPIIINSYGRSGSTVLTKSIINSSTNIENKKLKELVSRSIYRQAWNLEDFELKKGLIYKTHDYPQQNGINRDTRMIYTFADPVDVVLSLLQMYENRGEKWMQEHYRHLKVPFTNFENIVREDQLKLERHLNSWLNEKRFPIAFVKYESMWKYQDKISDFLGFQVELPPFRQRKAKNSNKYIPEIKAAYMPLRKNIDRLDDFFTNEVMC